jgi:hypothetical protein
MLVALKMRQGATFIQVKRPPRVGRLKEYQLDGISKVYKVGTFGGKKLYAAVMSVSMSKMERSSP